MKKHIAKLRWYDSLTGHGAMRLVDNEVSYSFYICNFIGADSHYPHLVTNIKADDIKADGQLFEVTLDSDPDILKSCGLSNIKFLNKKEV